MRASQLKKGDILISKADNERKYEFCELIPRKTYNVAFIIIKDIKGKICTIETRNLKNYILL